MDGWMDGRLMDKQMNEQMNQTNKWMLLSTSWTYWYILEQFSIKITDVYELKGFNVYCMLPLKIGSQVLGQSWNSNIGLLIQRPELNQLVNVLL